MIITLLEESGKNKHLILGSDLLVLASLTAFSEQSGDFSLKKCIKTDIVYSPRVKGYP